MSSKIKYSLEEVKRMVERYEQLKDSGRQMIKELEEVISENQETLHLFHSDNQSLAFSFMDLHFVIQVEIASHKINAGLGYLKFYLYKESQQEYTPLEDMDFSFDDSGNIQQSADFYHFSADVFPYVFISMLADFIVTQWVDHPSKDECPTPNRKRLVAL